MSIFDENLPRSSEKAPKPGEDLYGLSVSELDERITLYQKEIS